MSPQSTLKQNRAVGESSLFRAALLIMVLGWLAAPVCAHPTPFSYLDLRLSQSQPGQNQLEGALVAHVVDLAHDLNVTSAEALLDPALAESKKESILNLLRARL